jgi:hypothetical protein
MTKKASKTGIKTPTSSFGKRPIPTFLFAVFFLTIGALLVKAS